MKQFAKSSCSSSAESNTAIFSCMLYVRGKSMSTMKVGIFCLFHMPFLNMDRGSEEAKEFLEVDFSTGHKFIPLSIACENSFLICTKLTFLLP